MDCVYEGNFHQNKRHGDGAAQYKLEELTSTLFSSFTPFWWFKFFEVRCIFQQW